VQSLAFQVLNGLYLCEPEQGMRERLATRSGSEVQKWLDVVLVQFNSDTLHDLLEG
jgi:hypothetical protein